MPPDISSAAKHFTWRDTRQNFSRVYQKRTSGSPRNSRGAFATASASARASATPLTFSSATPQSRILKNLADNFVQHGKYPQRLSRRRAIRRHDHDDISDWPRQDASTRHRIANMDPSAL